MGGERNWVTVRLNNWKKKNTITAILYILGNLEQPYSCLTRLIVFMLFGIRGFAALNDFKEVINKITQSKVKWSGLLAS